MQTEVFKAMYEAGGTQEVTDEELASFFNENYVASKYFSVNLYTTEEQPTVDADGNETTENVDTALSAEDVQAYEEEFAGYQEAIAGGTSYDDVISAYMEKHTDVTSDPTLSEISTIEDTSLGEELKAELEKLSEGEAAYLIVGDDDNSKVLYFLYKEPITNKTEEYLSDESQRDTVLHKMKDEEFNKHLEQVADELDVTVSGAVNGYQPKKFEEKKKK